MAKTEKRKKTIYYEVHSYFAKLVFIEFSKTNAQGKQLCYVCYTDEKNQA